jgi:hypothetical protein
VTTATPLPGTSASLTAKLRELERARADVDWFAGIARRCPSSPRAAMLLDGARAWERRVLAFLAAAGWSQP